MTSAKGATAPFALVTNGRPVDNGAMPALHESRSSSPDVSEPTSDVSEGEPHHVHRGHPIHRLNRRQVRLVAGGLVASGILASAMAPPAKRLSGAIRAGLTTAPQTDPCPMGSMLCKLPDNRDLEPDAADVISALAR